MSVNRVDPSVNVNDGADTVITPAFGAVDDTRLPPSIVAGPAEVIVTSPAVVDADWAVTVDPAVTARSPPPVGLRVTLRAAPDPVLFASTTPPAALISPGPVALMVTSPPPPVPPAMLIVPPPTDREPTDSVTPPARPDPADPAVMTPPSSTASGPPLLTLTCPPSPPRAAMPLWADRPVVPAGSRPRRSSPRR